VPSFLSQLAEWEAHAFDLAEAVRCAPLTVVFVAASTWWVKWPLFVAVGAWSDVRCRRPGVGAAISAALAAIAAAGLTSVLKDLFDRVRPALTDQGIDALVATPASPSFPSGHAATAFAAAIAVGAFYPRLRWPLLTLATLVGLSRIYLGVHFSLDVLAGATLGVAAGLVVVWAIRLAPGSRERCDTSRRAAGTSFARTRRSSE
jgi:undecaprenyl-diphosphatase